MALGKILDIFTQPRAPNNFSELMGEKVKQARIDAGLSQEEFAKQTYQRQATISDIENGKRFVSTPELLYLSAILKKPIIYFFPDKYKRHIEIDRADPDLDELLLVANKLDRNDLRRIIIQARALIKGK
jgi:transcriptional regulator with XRE-family HTH domain